MCNRMSVIDQQVSHAIAVAVATGSTIVNFPVPLGSPICLGEKDYITTQVKLRGKGRDLVFRTSGSAPVVACSAQPGVKCWVFPEPVPV